MAAAIRTMPDDWITNADGERCLPSTKVAVKGVGVGQYLYDAERNRRVLGAEVVAALSERGLDGFLLPGQNKLDPSSRARARNYTDAQVAAAIRTMPDDRITTPDGERRLPAPNLVVEGVGVGKYLYDAERNGRVLGPEVVAALSERGLDGFLLPGQNKLDPSSRARARNYTDAQVAAAIRTMPDDRITTPDGERRLPARKVAVKGVAVGQYLYDAERNRRVLGAEVVAALSERGLDGFLLPGQNRLRKRGEAMPVEAFVGLHVAADPGAVNPPVAAGPPPSRHGHTHPMFSAHSARRQARVAAAAARPVPGREGSATPAVAAGGYPPEPASTLRQSGTDRPVRSARHA
ncbi:hypothetical protein OG215_38725 (plasmid) [Streptomyces globisporus]|uniref:hypothetical protein n=1 Tax=Streptomyces globisporus TaxID=1908 RepID=UPI0038670FD7|nr:hypothetical protein OG215_38725 [Streptomyces globisporus]